MIWQTLVILFEERLPNHYYFNMKNRKEFLDSRREDIIKWMSEHRSFSYMYNQLKISRDTIRKYIKQINPNYKGNQGLKGGRRNKRKSALELIKSNSTRNSRKRERLIEDGLKERKCECCGLSEWMGKPIPLELHHKDFNHYNNELDNLMIVCSNCHMQLHGYSNNI